MLNRKLLKEIDWFLLLLCLIIFALGIVFLYSASYSYARNFPLRQICWMGIGLLFLTTVLTIGTQKIVGVGYLLYGINLGLLFLVLVAGYYSGGAYRWLRLGAGGFGFQPSEFAKISLILVLAHYLGDRDPRDYEFKSLFFSFLFWLAPFVLIALQPDLGTALTLAAILFGVLFFWGVKRSHILTMAISGAALFPLFWRLLRDYQKARLLVFLNPELGDAYQTIQSRIAIGSGRLLGKGFLQGTQNRLGFIPGRHTDFIFSVIGEEWGFLGAVLLIFLFGVLLYRCLSVVRETRDQASRLVVVGVAVMIGFHAVVNLGMAVGLLPVVGLPLPWVSYGGSNLLANMIGIGLILGVKMRRTIF